MVSKKALSLRGLSALSANTEAARKRVQRFRYGVIVDELGQTPPGTDSDARMLYDPLDEGAAVLYVESDNRVVASLRLRHAAASSLPSNMEDKYQLSRFVEFGKGALATTGGITIDREWRNTPILAVLLASVFKLCRENQVRFDFCQCTPDQLRLYRRLGYRHYAPAFSDGSGLKVPLVLLTEDLPYLSAVKSPFLNIAKGYDNPPETRNWFSREFPDADVAGSAPDMNEDDFWVYLARRLHDTPQESVPLLNGLDSASAKKLVSSGAVLRCGAGETLLKAGESAAEMYVLLAGALEVRGGDDNKTVIATLSQGAVFGEVGFLSEEKRTADVVSLAESEVLVLTRDFLEKLMETNPKIAARVLFNLSLTMCERLAENTARLGIDAAPQAPDTHDTAPLAVVGV